ncbi:rhomboid-like protein [Mycobacterium sp. NPDC050853]|uniref:rhomboid-like protein n=1 Tax=Mycobacterium sp. NPDC050853 TaxID=3155160 RepID=UPI0033EF7F36
MRRVWAALVRLRVTIGYAAALVAVATVLVLEGPRMQDRVVAHASTNLHNLHQGRLGTLIGSAFVTDAGPIYLWLPGLVCILALAELQWHSGRLALTFALGHIGTTLIVGLGLALAIWLHWAPVSIARVSDVGMSYGTAAVLGALTPSIPSRWRASWVIGWITVGVVSIACNQMFTEVGHLIALILGMLVARTLPPLPRRAPHWTALRLSLLAFGGLFALMMFAEDGPTLAAAAPTAIAAVLVTQWVNARRRPRDQVAIA